LGNDQGGREDSVKKGTRPAHGFAQEDLYVRGWGEDKETVRGRRSKTTLGGSRSALKARTYVARSAERKVRPEKKELRKKETFTKKEKGKKVVTGAYKKGNLNTTEGKANITRKENGPGNTGGEGKGSIFIKDRGKPRSA